MYKGLKVKNKQRISNATTSDLFIPITPVNKEEFEKMYPGIVSYGVSFCSVKFDGDGLLVENIDINDVYKEDE